MKNIGVVHQNFLPIGMLGASTDKPYKLDVDKAKALLAKAGLPNGFKVTMDTRSVQPVTAMAEACSRRSSAAGIELEILPGDGKQTLTKYRARTHDIYIGTWGADYWDPHTNADTFARNPDNGDDAKSKPLAWRNAWAIPELTKKSRRRGAGARWRQARQAMYEEIQAEFRKTSPFVMLFQQTEVAAYRSNVEGLKIGPDLGFDLHVQGTVFAVRQALSGGSPAGLAWMWTSRAPLLATGRFAATVAPSPFWACWRSPSSSAAWCRWTRRWPLCGDRAPEHVVLI
jgi:ABC-type transport system substrate-binding protein